MKSHLFLPVALIITLSGCSSVPESNPLLEQARSDYHAAQTNPKVVNLAPGELAQASDAIDKANEASSQNKDKGIVNHLAYLAKQRSAIAQETAKQKSAEQTVENAAMQRSETRLNARTEEANRAQQRADESQRQAARSQQQTRDAQMRTEELESELKDLKELNAKTTERGIVITLGDVLFDTNKSDLKSGGTRSLKKLSTFLKNHPERMVLVEGHTDSTGSAKYNLELSQRRSKSVQSALMNMGISKDRISTQGYGLKYPIADNATAEGRRMNRRVEIVLPHDDNSLSTR